MVPKVGLHSQVRGFNLARALIAVLVISVVAAVAVPGLRARGNAESARQCVRNLRALKDCKEQWLSQHATEKSAPVRSDLDGQYLSKWPECPAGGSYELNAIGVEVSCTCGGDHKL